MLDLYNLSLAWMTPVASVISVAKTVFQDWQNVPWEKKRKPQGSKHMRNQNTTYTRSCLLMLPRAALSTLGCNKKRCTAAAWGNAQMYNAIFQFACAFFNVQVPLQEWYPLHTGAQTDHQLTALIIHWPTKSIISYSVFSSCSSDGSDWLSDVSGLDS